jgi:two-component system, OmpR family, sensor histidine kinase KdpD
LRPLLSGHELVLDVPADLPPVPLDYVEIDEVLTNLIENAAKHTPAGTQVEVTARLQDDEVVIQVADDGPGIDTAALPHIFEPFFRAAGARVRGTGLGLAVARGLVEAHGGRIWAANQEEGGAVISFALPLTETTVSSRGPAR